MQKEIMYKGQKVVVTVVPYNKQYEKAVRKSEILAPRQGLKYDSRTNVDGY